MVLSVSSGLGLSLCGVVGFQMKKEAEKALEDAYNDKGALRDQSMSLVDDVKREWQGKLLKVLLLPPSCSSNPRSGDP